jgi:hypothetical protein
MATTKHKAYGRPLLFSKQCFDAIVEEDLLKGQSIRDRVAVALFYAFYLAIKNDHATTALASARVLLCGPFHSRGPTLAAAIRRQAFYCLERSKEIGVVSLTKAVCVHHHSGCLPFLERSRYYPKLLAAKSEAVTAAVCPATPKAFYF